MTGSPFLANRQLSAALADLLSGSSVSTKSSVPRRPAPQHKVPLLEHGPIDSKAPVRAVVTLNEVNHLHGTGPLVMRICRDWRNVVSIRARSDFGGVQEFGDWQICLSGRATTRAEFFETVLRVLNGQSVEAVLCIPFAADDFLTAIAIQESFDARLCAYLMDDQNIAVHNIPDSLMHEFLQRCSLRLITHPELRYAYEEKFQRAFHLLPAVVPDELIASETVAWAESSEGQRRGALLGSFWDQSWFDRLCAALGGQWQIDWFGNNKSPWFNFDAGAMSKAGIAAHGLIPERQLSERLKHYPFILVPVSPLDASDTNHGVARLSLPGRILFALATSHTPILIVGSPATCAARFVSHFEVGEVAPYDAGAISNAMERITQPETQRRMREQAARIAPFLTDRGVARWLDDSITAGAPVDARFEELFGTYDAAIELGGTKASSLPSA